MSIVKKTSTLLDDTIHISFGCIVHLHGHWNKVMPLMNPFILANLSNDTKFYNCTYWLTNDTRSHCLSH